MWGYKYMNVKLILALKIISQNKTGTWSLRQCVGEKEKANIWRTRNYIRLVMPSRAGGGGVAGGTGVVEFSFKVLSDSLQIKLTWGAPGWLSRLSVDSSFGLRSWAGGGFEPLVGLFADSVEPSRDSLSLSLSLSLSRLLFAPPPLMLSSSQHK